MTRWIAALLVAVPAVAAVRVEFTPPGGPGFFATPTGAAHVSNTLLTIDADTTDYRGGGSRYYRRQFTREEFNSHTNLRITVTLRVLESIGSPAATCLQFTTPQGRTFGLGFVPGEAVLYTVPAGPPPQFQELYSGQDWLREPLVLARRKLDIARKHTYILQLRRTANGGRITLRIPAARGPSSGTAAACC